MARVLRLAWETFLPPFFIGGRLLTMSVIFGGEVTAAAGTRWSSCSIRVGSMTGEGSGVVEVWLLLVAPIGLLSEERYATEKVASLEVYEVTQR